MERKIVIPAESEFVPVNVRKREGKLFDGTYVETGGYAIRAAMKYPVFEGGSPVILRHRDAPQFLREQNQAYSLSGSEALRWPYGFDDESVRDELGIEHDMFNENFGRRGAQWTSGYFGDAATPMHDLPPVEGVNQQLVQMRYYLRTLGGDILVGLVTAAPSGMAPRFTKDQLEGIIGARGLKRLAELRGYDIYEAGDQIVDVRNPLCVVQLTFPHDFQYKGRTAPHSHHVCPPAQQGEAVGVRGAVWYRHRGGLRCFDVFLYAFADDSYSDRSFPLVRGEAKIKIGQSAISFL